MAKTASLNIRIDPETKQGAEHLYAKFGITVTDAVNIFLHQSLLVGGLPFEMKQPRYNAETEAAMLEAESIALDPTVKGYTDLDEMFKDLSASV
jgi:DNA-damage-inducible protein J